MEMSHRSKAFDQIIQEAEKDLRDLMHIPDNYKCYSFRGGASLQFAMIPMNLNEKTRLPIIVRNRVSGQRKHGRKHRKYGKAKQN